MTTSSKNDDAVTIARLNELDALYAAEGEMGVLGRRRTQLDALVEALRAIRRRVEAGTTVRIEGTETRLTTWAEFYAWAHGRYPLLEEAAEHWIGDDAS